MYLIIYWDLGETRIVGPYDTAADADRIMREDIQEGERARVLGPLSCTGPVIEG